MSNNFDIRAEYPVSDSEWLSYCIECPYTTFFQTPMWVKAFEKYSSGKLKADTRIIEFHDGIKILFPIAVKKLWWMKIGICMPASTYGGWLSREKLQIYHAESMLKYMKKKHRDLHFVENPYDPLLSTVSIDGATNVGTSTIDLSHGIDYVLQQSKYYHKKNVKTAEKNGVSVSITEELPKWIEYYKIYQESIQRWKEKNIFTGVQYDFKLFEILFQLNPLYRRLWIASIEGNIVAGILCFYWNRHVVAWNGSGLSDYFNCRPNNLLYQSAIEHACENGYHWFDCNPSGGLEGVSSFKQGLGALTMQTRVLDQRSFTRKMVSYVRQHKLMLI